MKASRVRSPLQLLDGRFDHALLTTYSFNLRFFEQSVLRALWEAEVRNIVVFVDRFQLGEALSDRAPSSAGTAYHLVSAGIAQAAFHPKLILVSGLEGSRLCVSSANLTSDGQMRNLESAFCLDSSIPDHLGPIHEAGELFRRLSETGPPHSAAAVLSALASLPKDEGRRGPFRLIHNLDKPMLDEFPSSGSAIAISSYVDGNGSAARRIHERGRLTVVVDGQRIEAPASFFESPWDVDPRIFGSRLHAKAYEVSSDGRKWVLVGSPNLSEPALARVASKGNLEAAISIESGENLRLPDSEPWLTPDLALEAEKRYSERKAVESSDLPRTTSFDAWEEDHAIRTSGVPDGTPIDWWSSERWLGLGEVTGSLVELPDHEIRPSRVRAQLGEDRFGFAVVAKPEHLRARTKTRSHGPESKAVRELPLDVETVRVLENVLSHLYELSEISEAKRLAASPTARTEQDSPNENPGGLLSWRPRTPDDSPRIPPLFLDSWTGEQDALLALVGRVLRLEHEEPTLEDHELVGEGMDLESMEILTEQFDRGDDAPPPDEQTTSASQSQLDSYRRAFKRLFARGIEFIKTTTDPSLAGSAFIYFLQLVEELGVRKVVVEGRDQPLEHRKVLREVTLALLDTYLNRDEQDLLCLASAKVHLACLVRERARFSLRDKERIDGLSYRWASELVSLPSGLPAPERDKLDVDPITAVIWLEPYADRSDWSSIEKKASDELIRSHLSMSPWPMILGESEFTGRQDSPAWEFLAFSAPAGYEAEKPFGVFVKNRAESPVAAHILVCVPGEHRVFESFERSADEKWLSRAYLAPTKNAVESVVGPGSLDSASGWREGDRPNGAEIILAWEKARTRI